VGVLWQSGPPARDDDGDSGSRNIVAQVERQTPEPVIARGTLVVQVSRTAPPASLAMMGPPPPERTLIVTFAESSREAQTEVEFEEEAGYF
jgi:hypothetical protein